MIATVLRLLRRRSEGSSDRKTAPGKAAELSISNELKPSRAAVGSEDGVHGTLKALVEQLVRQPPPLYNPGNVPPRVHDCELNLITSPQQLATVVEQLSKLDRFALDVEHHSTHTYSGITCLVQISTGVQDFVIDALALGGSLRALHGVLSNPAICKVLHGGGNDVMWLQRDFGLLPVNIFDTEKACQALGLQQRSLGWLLSHYCQVESDKSLQQEDWRQRPLPEAMLRYAATDVHYLLYIADRLGAELAQRDAQGPCEGSAGSAGDRGRTAGPAGPSPMAAIFAGGTVPAPGSKLCSAVQRSQRLALNAYRPQPPRAAAELAALALMRRHVSEMRQEGRLLRPEAKSAGLGAASGRLALNVEERREVEAVGDCLLALCEWRDVQARELDEGPACVIPDDVLLALARCPPRSLEQLQEAVKKLAAGGRWQACQFPEAVCAAAHDVHAALREASEGQRPWVNPELSAMMQPAGPGGAAARRKHQDPVAFREKLARRFSAKRVVYENCMMLSHSGELLCHTDRKKLEWYLSKGIAVKVGDDPLTVRLTFQHKTTDQARGTSGYYQASKVNKCVVCGEEGHYLRYRVVPSCYRRAMPVHLKSHRSHDVVLLCVTCHEVAHGAAEKLKRRLAAETGIPLFPPRSPSLMPSRQQPFTAPGAAAMASKGVSSSTASASSPTAASPSPGGGLAAVHGKCREEEGGTARTRGGGSVEGGEDPAWQCDDTTFTASSADEASTSTASLAPAAVDHPSSAAAPPPPHPYHVRQAALALERHAGTMPHARRAKLEGIIRVYLGQPPANGLQGEVGGGAAEADAEGGTLPPTPGGLDEEGGGPAGRTAGTPPLGQNNGGSRGVPVPSPEAAPPPPGSPPFTEEDLLRGLLAGLSARTRRKLLRSRLAQGRPLPPDLHREATAGCWGRGGSGKGGEEGGGAEGSSGAGAGAGLDASGGRREGVKSVEVGGVGGCSAGHMWHGQQVVQGILEEEGEEGLMRLSQRFRQCFVDVLRPKYLPPGWQVGHSAAREYGEHSVYNPRHMRGAQQA